MRSLIEEIAPYFHVEAVDERDGNLTLVGLPQQGEATDRQLKKLLKRRRLSARITRNGGRTHIHLQALPAVARGEWVVSLVLFVLTFLSTLWAGALQQGHINPFHPLIIAKALAFSFSLLAILGLHELGHYLYARRHHVEATLPYFIPAPTLIGTFGAVIRIRSPIPHRSALLQIGAAGPIFGFVVALVVGAVGILQSAAVPASPTQQSYLSVGDNLIFQILTRLLRPELSPDETLLLDPVAFAAWIGFLVTALNLIPIGQFDGGHIVYALFPRYHRAISRLMQAALVGLGFAWPGWWLWAAVSLLFFGVRRSMHQPTLEERRPLTKPEAAVGIFSLVIFVLCFIPVPFRLR